MACEVKVLSPGDVAAVVGLRAAGVVPVAASGGRDAWMVVGTGCDVGGGVGDRSGLGFLGRCWLSAAGGGSAHAALFGVLVVAGSVQGSAAIEQQVGRLGFAAVGRLGFAAARSLWLVREIQFFGLEAGVVRSADVDAGVVGMGAAAGTVVIGAREVVPAAGIGVGVVGAGSGGAAGGRFGGVVVGAGALSGGVISASGFSVGRVGAGAGGVPAGIGTLERVVLRSGASGAAGGWSGAGAAMALRCGAGVG